MQNTYKLHITTESLSKIENIVLKYPKKFQRHYFDLYLYVVDYVVRHSTITQKSVPLNRNDMSKLLGCNKQKTSVIINDLSEAGCIVHMKYFKFEVTSSHYGIPDEHSILYIVEHLKQSKTLARVINRRNEFFADYKMSSQGQLYYSYISLIHLDSITESIESLRIVYNSPIGVDLKLTKADRQYSNLLRIKSGDLFLKRPDPKSRVICNLSIVHRDLRKYLQFEGQYLKCVDLRNSQPLLAGMFIKDRLMKEGKPISGEINRYIQRCEVGMFYEDFMADPNVDRKTFKQQFFEQVFFSRVTKRKTKLKKLFIAKYPEIYEIICEIKGGIKEDKSCKLYAQFAVGLQRFEASIIYDAINLPMLREGFGCFNIYDSIVSHSDEVLAEATRRINIEFAKYGVKPTLNIEDFTKY